MAKSISVVQYDSPDHTPDKGIHIYIVKTAKNTTHPKLGARLSKAEIDELIETCHIEVSISLPPDPK